MAKLVRVDLGGRSYDITVGAAVPVGGELGRRGCKRALVVTDSNVGPLYGRRCLERLSAAGIEGRLCTIPAGEESKSLERLREVYDAALAAGLDRSSAVAALGGGVVGDLAGFAAATYLRGILFAQVPTSLLAMVDSSVGGKTGVNLAQGKNLAGVFHQPCEVAIDLNTLDTLPQREYVAGLAEVVKYGVIYDEALFARLEGAAERLLAREAAVLEDVVCRCCEIKAEVVSRDEHESGPRAILNYGHTLGHALENALGYGELLHGEAVALGMVFAGSVAVAAGRWERDEDARVEGLLVRLGLPVVLQQGAGPAWPALRERMANDKKTRGGIPRFVLADRIGHVDFGCGVDEDLLVAAYGRMQARG